jgi:ADP-L-glycero-D-manno-heptose 6-epimerase
MKILVTGGTGFIGSHLAKELLRQGHEVLVTGSCPERVPEGAKFMPHDMNGVDWRMVNGVETVFHQAACNNTLLTDRTQMIRSNFYAACDLFLALLHNSDCNQFVYASSTAVYGNRSIAVSEENKSNPLNVYGESKAKFDLYAMEFAGRYDVNVIGLRYCNVYGPGEEHKGARTSMVSKLAQTIKNDETPVLFHDGEQKREWIYVKDVVEANIRAARAEGSEIINCGTGKPYTFNQVVDILNEHYGKDLKPKYIENPHPEIYQSHVETQTNKAQEVLGFVPKYTLEDGVKDYL